MITVTIGERGVKVVSSKSGTEYAFSMDEVFSRRRVRKGVSKRRTRMGRPRVRARGTEKEIVKFLKSNGGAFTAQEIARHLIKMGKTTRRTVKSALNSVRSVIGRNKKTKGQIVSRGRNWYAHKDNY